MPILYQRVSDLSLSELVTLPSVRDAAATISRIYDFEKHPYFVWMRDSQTRLEEFRISQQPYRHFVEHFSRGLAAVLARVEALGERLGTIYDNVAEEHGMGEMHRSHRATYLQYLTAIGVKEADLAPECPMRVTMAYEALTGFCLTQPAEVGAAAMGIIEYTHIKVAAILSQTIIDRFWGDIDAQEHYRMHVELDVDHALSLFALCEAGWAYPHSRMAIAKGLLFGAHVWWTLFDSLHPAEIITPSATDGIQALIAQATRDTPRGAALQHRPASPTERKPTGVMGGLVRRVHPRRACALPVRWRAPGHEPVMSRATSINRFGLELVAAFALPLDAELELALMLHGQREPLLVRGRVRSLPGEQHGVCVEFQGLTESQATELEELMARL